MVRCSEIRRIPHLGDMELLSTRISNRKFPVHFHDTFVIQLVTSGADACESSGLAAAAQQVFIHTPYAVHSGGPQGTEALAYRALYPSLQLAEQLMGALPTCAPISFVSDCRALARLISTFDDDASVAKSRRQMRQVIQRVVDLAEVAGGEARVSAAHSIQDELLQARQYLVEHCRRDVTVAELSGVTLLSRFHLIRAFKKQFGITPRQFLISQRVLDAKQQLARGVPIAVAASVSGFSDQSHLTRCFQRVLGFNPGEFQRGLTRQGVITSHRQRS